jgi:hypothetical protein
MAPETTSDYKSSSRTRSLAQIAGLVIFGLSVSVLLILLLIRLFPQLEPGGQRTIFTQLDGDTFRHQPGLVRPPAENVVLEDVIRRDDPDGFRQPATTADRYPIIALGDSFTDGGQRPWVDFLAARLNTPVRNLGWSGFGPLEYAQVMRQFGDDYGAESRRWVLVAFFEGNDLSNTMTAYQRAQETGGEVVLNLDRSRARPITDVRTLKEYTDIRLLDNDQYLYPLTQFAPDGSTYELAYISDYIWWLNGEAETYRSSRNAELLAGALASIVADARAYSPGACVGLVYAPVKGHIYFPYADPDGNRRYVLENALTLQQDADGWLSFSGVAPVNYDLLISRFDNQRTVVREIAEAAGMQFIDLVPAFQQQAENGGPLTYYTYDSHWSEAGHRLASETAAAYLETASCE